jgi:hypothetical protein
VKRNASYSSTGRVERSRRVVAPLERREVRTSSPLLLQRQRWLR